MALAPEEEGVTKFQCDHQSAELVVPETLLRILNAWRRVMFQIGVLGQTPSRYGGAGYGNVSCRIEPDNALCGPRPFIISGTQTSGSPVVDSKAFCRVEHYDVDHNAVRSRGPAKPSSESMTHGALYDADPTLRFVLHGHSPHIWQHATALGIPTTDAAIAYGTREMAQDVLRLYQETCLPQTQLLAMGGHEDGVIAFGTTADAAGSALVRYYALALSLAG